MANRRPMNNGRRPDFGRNDRGIGKNFGRGGVNPWQGGGPGGGLPNLLPLAGNSTEATLALASNIINLLQPRQNPVPSLLDMPIRRDFGPNMGRFDRGGFGPNRMGNQNFRRTGNYNRSGERINNNRKPFRPNDGPRQQNKSSPKKDVDSKAKPVKQESEQDEKKQENDTKDGVKEEKKDGPKTRYDDIKPAMLVCHICNKSMWDGRSFENHLIGRAHAIMMQKMAESYALTADTMRQEFKIREMKRTRKSGQQPARDFYCAMCDMYAADGAVHRTTVGHRKLKKYLHPACTSCHKEMPTRIELDEHRLTAEHLKIKQDKQDVIEKPKPEVMVISTLSMEQSYLRDERHRRRRDDYHDKAEAKDENQDNAEKKEGEADGEGETKAEDKEIDNENTVLDYQEGDDLAGVTKEQFPAYSVSRGVGRSFLADFSCVQCRLCKKLLDGPEAADVHLRTWRHHQLFLRLLQERSQPKPQQSGSNEEQETADAETAQESPENNKRTLDAEESGNWKRRKTSEDEDSQDGSVKEDEPAGSGDGDGDGEPDGGDEMPLAEDLEDWNQIDEILQDEANGDAADETNVKEEKEEEPPAKVEEKPEAEKPRNTPTRGRGRGRGRGRRN